MNSESMAKEVCQSIFVLFIQSCGYIRAAASRSSADASCAPMFKVNPTRGRYQMT